MSYPFVLQKHSPEVDFISSLEDSCSVQHQLSSVAANWIEHSARDVPFSGFTSLGPRITFANKYLRLCFAKTPRSLVQSPFKVQVKYPGTWDLPSQPR